MLISQTPFRISFFGGGTDYHTWYQNYGAAVLSTTINHYCRLQCRFLPPFFEHKTRLVYSKIEEVSDNSKIEHPSVRVILKYLSIKRGVEIHHQGDLPARSGLGSSSSFTVGLLNAMYALKGMISSKRELSCEAIHIERDLLREHVGVQDQIATAYGGFNKIIIHSDGCFEVSPLIVPGARLQALRENLLLFFTGISRTASDIAADKIRCIPNKIKELQCMQQMVTEAESILCSKQPLQQFGKLLHESWQLKRSLSQKISPSFIDDIYLAARNAGAIGGKLLGAGGGGFILFFVEKSNRTKVCDALKNLLLVPFDFENEGSRIIYYDKQQYSQTSTTRRDYLHLNRKRLTRLPTVPEKNLSVENL